MDIIKADFIVQKRKARYIKSFLTMWDEVCDDNNLSLEVRAAVRKSFLDNTNDLVRCIAQLFYGIEVEGRTLD